MSKRSSSDTAGATGAAGKPRLTQRQRERLLFEAWRKRRLAAGNLTTEPARASFSCKRGKEYVP